MWIDRHKQKEARVSVEMSRWVGTESHLPVGSHDMQSCQEKPPDQHVNRATTDKDLAYTPHQAFLARSLSLPDPDITHKVEIQQFCCHVVLSVQAQQIESGPTYIHQDDLSIVERKGTHDEQSPWLHIYTLIEVRREGVSRGPRSKTA